MFADCARDSIHKCTLRCKAVFCGYGKGLRARHPMISRTFYSNVPRRRPPWPAGTRPRPDQAVTQTYCRTSSGATSLSSGISKTEQAIMIENDRILPGKAPALAIRFQSLGGSQSGWPLGSSTARRVNAGPWSGLSLQWARKRALHFLS